MACLIERQLGTLPMLHFILQWEIDEHEKQESVGWFYTEQPPTLFYKYIFWKDEENY